MIIILQILRQIAYESPPERQVCRFPIPKGIGANHYPNLNWISKASAFGSDQAWKVRMINAARDT